ncbi:hypothetical protein GB937_006053 [Aspergillus fischeri]|nr:hypothetical protein GB937_006053 [Aspergillus fischeri]
MSPRQLENKVALVTGASSGIGRAVALSLAKEGSHVICADLQPEANPRGFDARLETSTTDLILEGGRRSIFVRVDISDSKQVENAFSTVIKTASQEFGRLDILVNCAGYWAPFRQFAEEDDELWSKMLAVNSAGTGKMCRLAIRQFLKQGVDPSWGSRGRIVNISSAAGVIAFAGEVAYSITKASVNHLTRTAALDHAKDSINVNCVAPGTVATGMARGNFEDEDILALMKRATPWPRLGNTQDIAAAVLFFCLPSSQWTTGQVLAVDGGMTLGVPAT